MSQPKVNKGILIGGLLIVLPLVGILYSGFGKDPKRLPNELEGRPAPAFSLVDLDGNPVSLEQIRGKPVVLNFWSTWCGPCKAEHPLLQDRAKANPEVAFYGVIYQDEPQKVLRYLSQVGTAYAHLVDDGNRVAIDYGVTGVPETFFIDKDGVIAHKSPGPVYPQLLDSWIQEIRP